MAEVKIERKMVDVEVGTHGLAKLSVRFPSAAQKAAEMAKATEAGLATPKAPLLCTLKLTLDNGMTVVGVKYVKSDFAGSTRKDGTVAPNGFIRMPSFKSGKDYIDYVGLPKEVIAEVSRLTDGILDKDAADTAAAEAAAAAKATKVA